LLKNIVCEIKTMATSRLGLAGAWGQLKQIRFNQDKSCFVCAFEDGVRIYNVDPIRELAHLRQGDVGSLAIAEMLFRYHLLKYRSTKLLDTFVYVFQIKSCIVFQSETS
jgi:hypothetical protein